jgi:hypothetical protein
MSDFMMMSWTKVQLIWEDFEIDPVKKELKVECFEAVL